MMKLWLAVVAAALAMVGLATGGAALLDTYAFVPVAALGGIAFGIGVSGVIVEWLIIRDEYG